jgi:predicted dehydrogenase
LLEPARTYTDYRDMAAAEAARDDGIDAVAIVTPNHLHAPVARAFMDAGIDVICDKPVAATLPDALDLRQRRADSGLVFGVTYPYASHVMARQMREMVRDGAVGEIRQVHVEYFQEWAIEVVAAGASGPWRLDPARSGPAFTVADIGTHAEHLVRFVTGRPIEALRAEFHVTGSPKPMEDTAFMHLRLAGGVPGTLMVSQALAGSHCALRLRVCGTKATLDWDQENPEFLDYRPVGAPRQVIARGHSAGMAPAAERLVRMPRGHPEALTDAWANLYLELAVAVEARRTGRPLAEGLLAYPTLEDGIAGLRFVDAAVRADADGGWVGIDWSLGGATDR